MVRALRRSRLVSLIAVLLLCTAIPSALPLWHDDGDDPLCAPQLVVHDHNAHRIEASESAPAQSEHCLLCHWAQSFRSATTGTRFVLPDSPSAIHHQADTVTVRSILTAGPSGRAPPVLI